MNGVVFAAVAVIAVVVAMQAGLLKGSGGMAGAARRVAAAAAMGVAGFFLFTGRVFAAVPILIVALGLAGASAGGFARLMRPLMGRWGGLFSRPRAEWSREPGGRRSTVRTGVFEMNLDHDSGAMNGRVLSGRQAGRELGSMDLDELMTLWREVGSDLSSRSLLEAYLDRRHPLWRQDPQADAAARGGGAASPGTMTDDEAHQILGLRPGASEAEVREAHRRLIKAVHPDLGGSTFLAAKINQAKDRLVGKHTGRSNH